MQADMALTRIVQKRHGGEIDRRAVHLFDRLVRDPQPGFFQKLFGKRLKPLLSLAQAVEGCQIVNRRHGGVRVIALDTIHGSLNRSTDFDHDFRPLQQSDHGRWCKVASAMLSGMELPPIELIQIGHSYFVKDGHHRISVARALGYRYLDAVVEVWTEA